jgi:hypothetical protein
MLAIGSRPKIFELVPQENAVGGRDVPLQFFHAKSACGETSRKGGDARLPAPYSLRTIINNKGENR